MSDKMNKLVLLSALMIAIIGTFGTVSAEEFDLIAGGGNEMSAPTVGVVDVTDDGVNLSVTYSITESGWCLNETHLHIANESEYIPQTKKGNPIPGKFDNSTDHDCVIEYTYVVPLSEIEISTTGTVCIAAHAVVQLEVEELDVITTYEESAWGEGEDFEGKNWAMYFTYTIA